MFKRKRYGHRSKDMDKILCFDTLKLRHGFVLAKPSPKRQICMDLLGFWFLF